MKSWKVMHKLPFFPCLGSDLSWSPQNVMKNKASSQHSYVQFKEKNQPSGGLERSRNRALNKNKHDIGIESSSPCWSD